MGTTKDLREVSTETLVAELARRQKHEGERAVDVEEGLHKRAQDMENASYAAYLEELEAGQSHEAQPCPRCGRLVKVRVKNRVRTIHALSGSHRLRRHYHYCTHCSEGFYPLDAALGLRAEGEVTEALEKRLIDFSVNEPYAEAAERVELHYGFSVSTNLLRCVTERVGQDALSRSALRLHQELLPKRDIAARLTVQTDGSMIPLLDRWKEAKLAVVVRQDCHVPGTTQRRGTTTEARYTATLEGVESFETLVDAVLTTERADECQQVVWAGDGAPWQWDMADRICPTAVQILDWPHAIQHAVDCAKIVFDEDVISVAIWKREVERMLADDRLDVILADLEQVAFQCRSKKKRKAVLDLHRYYTKNQHRMTYRCFREHGFVLGSGLVESAHRHVLQKRMKRAGQHWGLAGAEQMAHLRAAYKTAGPKEFYDAIRRAA